MTEEVNQDLSSDKVVDELYEKVQAPTPSSVPMKEPKAKSLDPDMYEFTSNGKQIKATLDEVLKWASQGHDYSQKMESLKGERSEFDSSFSKYKEIDEYAIQNPDWFNHVQDAFTSKDQITPQEGQDPEINAMKQQLNDLSEFKNEFTAEKNREQRGEEDKLLDMEIKSIKETYPNLDWNKPNEEGHTLEKKVLQHAMDNGVSSFKIAFRDYMHDNLITSAEERGKEVVGKDLAKKTKLGILGETSTPTKGLQGAVNIKGKSYEQLMQEGLDEIPSS